LIGRLLDAASIPNTADPGGETALMTATRTGAVAAMRLLIERGAHGGRARAGVPADRADDRGARGSRARRGRAAQGRGIGQRADAQGPTPAFVPPCKGTGCGSEGVGINRGGLPDRGRRAEVKGGMTPLLYAARDGTLEPARLLVAAGADLELGDGNASGRC
jgi:ankyrin repeat protein